jgi:alkaline phosphatase
MNGRIGVDDAGTAARGNLIEAALLAGKAVGIVSTGDVTGTGAAAFTAHTLVKDMNEAVAVQQVGKGLSVLIGGGANRFQPTTRSDRRDLILELRRRNINVAVNPTQFRALQTPPVAAFLAPGALPADIDRNVTAGTPTLEEMVIKAVDILRKDRKAGTAGYLLVVIGANLESLAETGDVHGHVSELLAWDKAFNYARSVAAGDSSRKTLVASISDGEVGGLVIGGGTFIARNTALRSRQGGLVGPSMDPVAAGQIIKAPSELVRDKFLADAALDAIYPNFWSTAPLRTAVKSAAAIAAAVRAATPSPENPLTSAQLSVIVSAGLGLTTDTALSAAEVALVLSGYRFSLKLWGPANTASLSEQLSAKPLEQAIGKVVSSRANAGFTHHGRGGQDTNVYAMGAASQRYAGLRSHSDFAKLTAEILGIDLDAATTSSSAVDIGGCPWADARCSP